MNRRDLLLQEMQITQWILTKPQVLKGEAQIHLNEQTRLVVVCDEEHQQSPLFEDVLRALKLPMNAAQWFDTEQAKRISFTHSPMFWLIVPPVTTDEFAKKWANQTAWQTPSWQALEQAQTKRQLWQQIADFCLDEI